MRVAMIGLGRWGRKIMRVLVARCDVVVACSEGGAAGRDWLAEHHPRIRHTSSLDEVLAEPSIDAVLIATPIDTHAELVRRALNARKHVFVEKPLATTGTEARALVELAKQVGRTLSVGHVFLYDPAFEHLEAITRDDPIVHATMSWTKLGTFDSDLWWNLGSHYASLALVLFRERPVRVRSFFERGVVTRRDVVAAQLHFDGGRECALWIDRCSPRTARAVTALTRSGRVLAWVDDSLAELDVDRLYQPLSVATAEPLAREIDGFLAAASGGVLPKTSGEHGLMTVELVERLIEAGAP